MGKLDTPLVHFVAQCLEEGGGVEPLPITQYLGVSVPLFSGIKPYLSPKTAPSKFVCRFLQVSQPCLVDPLGTPNIIGAKLENRTLF